MVQLLLDKTAGTLTALLLSTLAITVVHAATIDVVVLDRDGAPVPEIVVYIVQDGVKSQSSVPKSAVMDQRDKRFVPHILVVQKGTAVEFPNSDVTGHHVYSFSNPNNFVLPLYKGDPNDPVVFEYDGVVTLGCNIHDHMLGYIVVVDTDVFGHTDASGRVSLTVDNAAKQYVVSIWSPRIRDSKQDLVKVASNVSSPQSELVFALQKRLRAPHHKQTDAVKWSEY